LTYSNQRKDTIKERRKEKIKVQVGRFAVIKEKTQLKNVEKKKSKYK
jgi:hypothetical protein